MTAKVYYTINFALYVLLEYINLLLLGGFNLRYKTLYHIRTENVVSFLWITSVVYIM